ncbi:hypothetical protein WMW72_01060 [Paenibacillus filicis]|uniref:DUF2334 domain-containing protein n=1 Tax=Paenibacillus filicis TaxID=669464 RepID=A0ABU9DE00_9BACL
MLRKKAIPMLLLSLCFLLASACFSVQASANGIHQDSPPKQVLLIYDSLSLETRKEGNVEAIQRLLAAFSVQVTLTSFDRYEAGTLKKYDYLIAVRNAQDLPELPAVFDRDFAAYSGHYLHVGQHVPDQAAQALELQEEPGGRDTARLTLGQFSQSPMIVEQLPYIVRYAGKAYGSWSSGSRSKPSPYGVANGRYGYVPYLEKGNLSELGLSYLLQDWLASDGQSQYYAVFKDIYPFSDLGLLKRLADQLYESGIPFIASIQPVLSNFDYPAMQRYMETLKYVQSRNGSLVVNAPFVASTISQNITTLKDEMSSFIDVLAEHGIAPLGIGAEMYWTYDEHYTARGMSFFDSIVMFPNERVMYRAPTDTAKTFATSFYTVESGKLEAYGEAARSGEPLPMNTALVFRFPQDEQQLKETVATLQSDWRTFGDYKNTAHAVRTDKHDIRSSRGILQINGRTLVLNTTMESVDSNHTYIQEGPKSLDTLFTVQNNIFIVLIITTLMIFGGFLIVGYRLYKRKYIHPERKL